MQYECDLPQSPIDKRHQCAQLSFLCKKIQMTFKGMLKILMIDYHKQNEKKMFSIADELIRTRRELREVKEKFHRLGSGSMARSHSLPNVSTHKISLYVQYNGFFNQLCTIRWTVTIRELLVELRHLTGIPLEHPIGLRVLSEDGLKTLFFLHGDPDRTLASFHDRLKPRMILNIDDSDDDGLMKMNFRACANESDV